jgi:hypothetical protein
VFTKTATGSESSVSVSTVSAAGVMLAYRGISALDVVGAYASNSFATTSVTTTAADDLVISIYRVSSGSSFTWTATPSGTTSRVNQAAVASTNNGLLIVDEDKATAGATTARAATASGGVGAALAIAFKQSIIASGTLVATEADDTISAAGAVKVAATLAATEADDTLAAAGTGPPRTGSASITEGDDFTNVQFVTTDWKQPGSAISGVTSEGTGEVVAWTSPGNAEALDGSSATAAISFPTNSKTRTLRVSNFGFTNSDIPSTAQISGIEVEITRKDTQSNSVHDLHLYLVPDGTAGDVSDRAGFDHADTSTFYPTTLTAVIYGTNSDTWGTTLTVSQAQSANFSVDLQCQGNVLSSTISIDAIRVRLSYTNITTTGSVKVQGTLAATEGADSITAAGTAPADGTLAATEGADSIAAAGTLPVQGAAAITEAADSISSAGTVKVAATLAATEADDTIAAAGAVKNTATLAATEASDTIAAAGTAPARGTLAATEGADSISAAGQAGAGGTLAATEASDSISAAGIVAHSGNAAITEAADSDSAAGTVKVAGAAPITEAGDTAAAAGSVKVQGAAAATEAGDSIAATGRAPAGGTLAGHEADDAVAAAGIVVTPLITPPGRIFRVAGSKQAGRTARLDGTTLAGRTGSPEGSRIAGRTLAIAGSTLAGRRQAPSGSRLAGRTAALAD